ncbi:mechanosensitive ion channel family protein [Roseovarius sp. 2305UL8-3]|uniref:mechanosensitive ion channel family protein n=1 Tax=Roseovarius conchicola TaxID=3121636 RepID=UPI0035272588
MENQPEIVTQALVYLEQGWEIAQSWLMSPAAWSQFALLIGAWLLAWILSRAMKPVLKRVLTPAANSTSIFAQVRWFLLIFVPLLLPLLAYVFTGIGESVTRQLFGAGDVIAFGKRVFLFLAVRILVRDILKDPMLRLLGRYVLLPIALIYALGALDEVAEALETTIVPLGNMSFNLLWLLQGLVAGIVIFWLGRWSNDQSHTYIQAQEEMPPATRQLAAKAAEIAIFGVAFLILMNIMGIPLTSLAVLSGAIGVGIGFGLQKIASNYISGLILLLEGQATVGDYVELDDGNSGTIVRTTARAMILETFDGRWVVVPNEDFITTRVINYSDQGSANRYEAEFSVSYDTDINIVPGIIETAVSKLDFILQKPDKPDCELRAFGDSGVEFAVEFWVNGIDDGKNRFTPVVMMTIWNALKDNDIEIPFPQQVVHHRGLGGGLGNDTPPGA